MDWTEIPLSKLVPAEWNYKVDDDLKKQALKENINKNGFLQNLIVRELEDGNYEVVNGNHRLEILEELAYESAISINLGKISDAMAYRIAIETNETRFQSDATKLGQLLKKVDIEFSKEDLMTTMPFHELDYQRLVDLADFDISTYNKPEPIDAEAEIKRGDDDQVQTDLKEPESNIAIWSVKLSKPVWMKFKEQMKRVLKANSLKFDERDPNQDDVIRMITKVLEITNDEDLVI